MLVMQKDDTDRAMADIEKYRTNFERLLGKLSVPESLS